MKCTINFKAQNYLVRQQTTKYWIKKNRTIITLACSFFGLALIFRLVSGIFVIQPVGIISEGVTIVCWRSGSNPPFKTSAEGSFDISNGGVSLIDRGLLLAKLAERITDREIFRLGYSEMLYQWSTGGKKYKK